MKIENSKKLFLKEYIKTFIKVFSVILVLFVLVAFFIISEGTGPYNEIIESVKLNSSESAYQKVINGKYKIAMIFFDDIYDVPDIYLSEEKTKEYLNDKINYNNIIDICNNIPDFDNLKVFLNKKKNISVEFPKFAKFRRISKVLSVFAEYSAEHGKFDDSKLAMNALSSMILYMSCGSSDAGPLVIEYMLAQAMFDQMVDAAKIIVRSVDQEQKNVIVELVKRTKSNMATFERALKGESIFANAVLKRLRSQKPFSITMIELFFNPFTKTEDIIGNFYEKAIHYYKNTGKTDFKNQFKEADSRNPFIQMAMINYKKIGKMLFEKEAEYKDFIEKNQ